MNKAISCIVVPASQKAIDAQTHAPPPHFLPNLTPQPPHNPRNPRPRKSGPPPMKATAEATKPAPRHEPYQPDAPARRLPECFVAAAGAPRWRSSPFPRFRCTNPILARRARTYLTTRPSRERTYSPAWPVRNKMAHVTGELKQRARRARLKLVTGGYTTHASESCTRQVSGESIMPYHSSGSVPRSSDPLVDAAWAGSLDRVEALLRQGSDPNATDNQGCSPLSAATRSGHVELMTALLAAGAHPNEVTENGGCLLALTAVLSRVEGMRLLLAAARTRIMCGATITRSSCRLPGRSPVTPMRTSPNGSRWSACSLRPERM